MKKKIGNLNFYLKGKKHQSWKGEESSYTAKHHWIKSVMGSPLKCEICGVENLDIRQYNWSNKDHKYRRIKKDWQRLCVSCHRKYDLEFIINEIKKLCMFCGKLFKTKSNKAKFCCKNHWQNNKRLIN